MKTAYILSGRITSEGGLELDERAPLPPGPVRISIEAVGESSLLYDDQELRRRKAHMDTLAGCLSDEEARQILNVIETEFEQVNLDEWR
jgi:hypothetical protein